MYDIKSERRVVDRAKGIEIGKLEKTYWRAVGSPAYVGYVPGKDRWQFLAHDEHRDTLFRHGDVFETLRERKTRCPIAASSAPHEAPS